MGTNSLPTAIGGAIIPPTDHNALVEALTQVFVPRNSSGNVADVAGSLGSSIYRWNFAYIVQQFIGTASENLKIYEGATGELWLEKNSTESLRVRSGSLEYYISGELKFKVDTDGLEGSLIKEQTIDHDSIATKSKIIHSNITGNSYFSDVTIINQTLNDCIAGKTIYFKLFFPISTNGDVDLTVSIEGSIKESIVDGSADWNSKVYTHTVQNDGNVNVQMTVENVITGTGFYIIEEA